MGLARRGSHGSESVSLEGEEEVPLSIKASGLAQSGWYLLDSFTDDGRA